MKELMLDEDNQEKFEKYAEGVGFDIGIDFFGSSENPYMNDETRLAFDIWCASISTVKAEVRCLVVGE